MNDPRIGFLILSLFILSFLGCNYLVRKSPEPLNYLSLDLEEFLSFLEDYNKNYSAYIHSFNSEGNTWKLGINFFADLTLEEYQSTYLPHKYHLKPIRSVLHEEPIQPISYPATVDWRTKGAVTPIKNQLACGGCYAFSAVSSIESAWFLAGHPLTSFSEQSIIDCSSIYGNDHCYGGMVDHAFEYAQKVGIPTEATYPYNSANEHCNLTQAEKVAVKISGFNDVTPNNVTALLIAVANQPVSVGVEADQMSWSFYKSGVITKDCGTNIDHAVVIDGYDTTQSIPYYIVRNSWGPKWGQAGYVYIEIKNGPGMCGIQQLPSYPYF